MGWFNFVNEKGVLMKKQLIMIFTLILSLMLILPVNNVYALVGDKQGDAFYDFEAATLTDTNCGDENIDITGIGGSMVTNSPTIDDKSWFHDAGKETYINFTTPHPEVFLFADYGSGATGSFYIEGFNDEDTRIFKVRFVVADGAWYNVDFLSAQNLWFTPSGTSFHMMRFTMNASDDIFLQGYRESSTTWYNVSDAPNNIDDNYNISYLYIHGSTVVDFYVDNVGYNDNVFGTEEYFDDSDYASICANPISGYINIPNKKYIEHKTESTYSMTIHSLLLPVSDDQLEQVSDSESDYTAFINGRYCGTPDYIQPYGSDWALIWDDLNSGAGFTISSEQLVFEFYCSAHTSGLAYDYYWYGVGWTGGGTGNTKVHSTSSLYGNGNLDGSYDDWSTSWKITPCWYYDTAGVSQPEPIPSVELINTYEDSYAENGTMGWFEFYEWFTDCYHRVGNNPYIIYNMSGNGSGESKIYRFDIVKVGDTGDFVYTGLITVTADYKTAYYRIPDYEFTEKGQYFIEVFNTSDYGLTYGDRVYTSRNIYVCESLDGIGVTDDPSLFPEVSNTLGMIIGLIVTVFMTLSPFILAGSISGTIQVPPVLYAVMGALGVIISTSFGWFPSYVLFFIIAVGIIVLALMYVMKMKGE